MAKVRDNLLVQGLSGKFGDQIVFRHLRDGRTIVCKKPDFSRRKLSREQKKHHQRFKEAAAYARSAAEANPMYAQLAAGTMKNAYNIALGDWFNPPVIRSLERRGRSIRILATDDVMVTGIRVTILDKKGSVLETGEAVKGKSDWWDYVPATEGTIRVEARDLPGNKVQREFADGE